MLVETWKWLRHDPFGPEVFGLVVEFLIIAILIPVVGAIWGAIRSSGLIRERGAILAAKLQIVRQAAHRFADLMESIRKRELLQKKYGITDADIRALFAGTGEADTQEADRLSDEERDEVGVVQKEIFDAADSFDEYAIEINLFLEWRGVAHNVEAARSKVREVRESVRDVRRYRVRGNLLLTFDDYIKSVFDDLGVFVLKIGKRTLGREIRGERPATAAGRRQAI